ncbi:MAG: penicillin-binding protein [Deferrisomatales bacterium]|nr:penicillin-binding protein [Deferrisomatales bacterium]
MSRRRAEGHRAGRAARWRIRVIAGCVMVLFALAALRAVQLQVFDAPELLARTEDQRRQRLELLPARGAILDRHGRELAKSIPGASVFVDPSSLLGAQEDLERLCAALGLKVREARQALERGGARFAWLKRRITPREEEAVRSLGISGVGIAREPHRTYPKKTLAGQVVGFVGIDGRGLGGLEYRFDGLLRGKPRTVQAERDARGWLLLTSAPDTAEGSGRSLVLTLDETIQHVVEEELARAVDRSKARGGIAVAMDPVTGEILALAQVPLFNPNAVADSRSEDRKVRAVVEVYEPGSTFKAPFLGILFDQRLARPSDIVYCENGRWPVHRRAIHDTKPHGWLSVADVLKVSSNIGVAKLSEKLSPQALYDGLGRFGLGTPTGVELGGESGGILPPPARWSKLTPKTVSYGQGVSATALQVVTAIAALGNGGVRMKPHLLRAVLDEGGREVDQVQPEVAGRAIGADAAASLVRIMEQVVSGQDGTGAQAAVPGYRVAGKTGTSWKPDLVKGGYQRDKVVVSFAGFVPSRAPRLALLVAVDEPTQGSRYGSTVAAPAFREMARRILGYLKVPPEPGGETSGPAVARRPQRGDAETPMGTMPDVQGLTMREVLRRLEAAGVSLRVSLMGSGVAATQDPAPGTPLDGGQACRIVFRPLL